MSAFGGCQPTTNTDLDFGAELASPAALADPHPVFHRMRREDPVHHSRTLGAWLVTRYNDVLRALRDPRLSSDRIPSILDAQVAAGDRVRVRDFERTRRSMMVNADGPAHGRLRPGRGRIWYQHGAGRQAAARAAAGSAARRRWHAARPGPGRSRGSDARDLPACGEAPWWRLSGQGEALLPGRPGTPEFYRRYISSTPQVYDAW